MVYHLLVINYLHCREDAGPGCNFEREYCDDSSRLSRRSSPKSYAAHEYVNNWFITGRTYVLPRSWCPVSELVITAVKITIMSRVAMSTEVAHQDTVTVRTMSTGVVTRREEIDLVLHTPVTSAVSDTHLHVTAAHPVATTHQWGDASGPSCAATDVDVTEDGMNSGQYGLDSLRLMLLAHMLRIWQA